MSVLAKYRDEDIDLDNLPPDLAKLVDLSDLPSLEELQNRPIRKSLLERMKAVAKEDALSSDREDEESSAAANYLHFIFSRRAAACLLLVGCCVLLGMLIVGGAGNSTARSQLKPTASPSLPSGVSLSPSLSPTSGTPEPVLSPSFSPETADNLTASPSTRETPRTSEPTLTETSIPTLEPTRSHSLEPTLAPIQISLSPTSAPSKSPSQRPTSQPSQDTFPPTNQPTSNPLFLESTANPTGFQEATLSCAQIRASEAVTQGNFGENNFRTILVEGTPYCGDTYGPDESRPNRNVWSPRIGRRDCPTFPYDQGRVLCETIGARICSREEFGKGVAHGTGCGGDSEYIYSSTDCVEVESASPGKFMFNVGLSTPRAHSVVCETSLDRLSLIRCCAVGL